MSIGISLFPHDSENKYDLLKFANSAKYRAKELGRNTLSFYHPNMQKIARKRLQVETDLRHALRNNELRLYCQPQFNSRSVMLGAEALIRWQHPSRGLVGPDEFIQIAEELDIIVPIGNWILREACRHMKSWLDNGNVDNSLIIAVNVSPRQFHQDDFVSVVNEIINEQGIPHTNLMLELTEGVVVEDIGDTITKMQALKALGVHISIDDFGTGYSSLSYLKRMPLDQLKIAETFVRDISSDPANAFIIQTIIDLGRNLGLQVIAEGVEQQAELDFLQAHGCELFQGYLFSKPLPADEVVKFMPHRPG